MSRLDHRLAKLEAVVKPRENLNVVMFRSAVEVGGDLVGRIRGVIDIARCIELHCREDETEGAFLSRYYRMRAPKGPAERMSDEDLQVLLAGRDESIALLLAHKKPIPDEALDSIRQSGSLNAE